MKMHISVAVKLTVERKKFGGRGVQRKREASVSVPHQIPTKYTERVHTLSCLIVNTVTCCLSRGQA